MQLTDELKERINALTYTDLLRQWRFGTIGDPMFQDESGKYFSVRMKELRNRPGGQAVHVHASKTIGW